MMNCRYLVGIFAISYISITENVQALEPNNDVILMSQITHEECRFPEAPGSSQRDSDALAHVLEALDLEASSTNSDLLLNRCLDQTSFLWLFIGGQTVLYQRLPNVDRDDPNVLEAILAGSNSGDNNGALLSTNPPDPINLSNTILREIDLSRTGANLSGAILNDIHWPKANLSGVNLSGADLRNAHLPKANLSDVNLSEADLGSARLNGANLSRAQVNGTDWEAADLSGATWTDGNSICRTSNCREIRFE